MTDKKRYSIERAIEVAAETFSHRSFGGVTVSEIAARARCSTATIYEAFGSKHGLYRRAVEAKIQQIAYPDAQPDLNKQDSALAPLLDFLSNRARILSQADHTEAQRLVSAQINVSYNIVGPMKDQVLTRTTSIIARQAQVAIDAGLIRHSDIDSITYILIACTAYHSLSGMFSVDHTEHNIYDILKKSLTPLLTDEGRRELQNYIVSKRGHTGEGRAASSDRRESA